MKILITYNKIENEENITQIFNKSISKGFKNITNTGNCS